MGIAIAIRMLVMPPVQRAPLDDRPLPSHRAEDCQYPPQEWSAFIRAVRKHPVKANGDSQNGQRVEADHQDQIHQAQAVSPAEVDAQKQAEEGHTNTKGHGRFFVEWFGGWKWRGAGRINSNRGKAVHSTLQSGSGGGLDAAPAHLKRTANLINIGQPNFFSHSQKSGKKRFYHTSTGHVRIMPIRDSDWQESVRDSSARKR